MGEHYTLKWLIDTISDLFSDLSFTIYFTDNDWVIIDWWDIVIGGMVTFLCFKIFNRLME